MYLSGPPEWKSATYFGEDLFPSGAWEQVQVVETKAVWRLATGLLEKPRQEIKTAAVPEVGRGGLGIKPPAIATGCVAARRAETGRARAPAAGGLGSRQRVGTSVGITNGRLDSESLGYATNIGSFSPAARPKFSAFGRIKTGG